LLNRQIALLNEKVNNITSNIQKSSGLEQEKINNEIADLRAELAGLKTRHQSLETRSNDLKKAKEQLEESIKNSEKELQDMSKSKGKSVKKELDIKKKQLDEIDEQKRKLMMMKSTLNALVSRIEEKERQMARTKNESDFTFNRVQQTESELFYKDNLDAQTEKIVTLKTGLDKLRIEIQEKTKLKTDAEKSIAVFEKSINDHIKIQSQVSSIDICPLCKTKITQDHINHVIDEAEKEKKKAEDSISFSIKSIKEFEKTMKDISLEVEKTEDELRNRSQDVLRLRILTEKKETLRKFTEEIKILEKEHFELIKKRDQLENQISSIKSSEANYDSLRLELQELERHEETNLGMELTLKQRDLERDKLQARQIVRELEEALEHL
jgi:chromosome segregation ATPase